MIRLVFRILGLILLAAAFAALIVDGTRSIAAGSFITTSLAETLLWAFPSKIEGLKPQIQHLNPYLWDPIMVDLLALPSWSIAGFIGFLAIAIAQRKPAKIGYSNRD
jgi:hypothetical protein